MRRLFGKLSFILLIFMLASCSSGNSAKTEESAADALNGYFTALHDGDYGTAVSVYGGSYEMMVSNNADIDPTDHAKLLERACTVNGNMCLEPASIVLESVSAEGDYLFTVKFLNDDGTSFVLGPCCGASETDMPPVEEFQYTVQTTANGEYEVLELPPYVP
jgi:hypothetical protein